MRSCATAAGVSWSRFNSYSDMHLSKQRNAISAANKILGIRSTISLISERTCSHKKRMLKVSQ